MWLLDWIYLYGYDRDLQQASAPPSAIDRLGHVVEPFPHFD
jgi:hypothetical protein